MDSDGGLLRAAVIFCYYGLMLYILYIYTYMRTLLKLILRKTDQDY